MGNGDPSRSTEGHVGLAALVVGARALSDTLDDALVPLSVLRERFRMPVSTMRRKLAGVPTIRFGRSGERAVRWGDAIARLKPREERSSS